MASLLLVWTGLERSVRRAVISLHGSLPPRAYGIASALQTWETMVREYQPASSLAPLLATTLRGQLQGPLSIRNGLCHGLEGISAETEQMPATLSWEMNDEKHSICWDDLQQQFGWLSRLPNAVLIISHQSPERFGSRLQDTAENREWWRSEFSLDLPEP